jgi:hypothetical protein
MGSLWFEDVARPQSEALEHELSVDAAVLGAGIVGLTTAFLLERQGARVAVLEGRRVAAGASGYNIDCDLRRKPNYTYTESESDLDQVREEAGVSLGPGLPASFVEDVDLPFRWRAQCASTSRPSSTR